MTTATHTPGPWKVDAYRSEQRVNCVYVKDSRGVLVAQCLHGPCAMDPTPEQLADAHLIAAAPYLLSNGEAFLAEVTELFRDNVGTDDLCGCTPDAPDSRGRICAFCAFRASIAAAKGGETGD